MLGLVVKELPHLGQLPLPIAEVSERHADAASFLASEIPAREALLWTLHQGLGDDYTNDLELAWRDALARLSSTIVESGAATAM
jgi:hypothetical protein